MAQPCKLCGFSEPEFTFDEAVTPNRAACLPELIRSNNPPSHTEESQLREVLADAVQCMDDLDVRIAALRHDLEVLIRQKAHKELEIQEYKLVLHPIRRIPRDVLCEIFLCFIDEDLESEELESSLDPTLTQWIIPRVSSHWRSVSLSFRRMWATIRIIPDDFPSLDIGGWKLFMLGVQLNRSGSSQLSVLFYSKSAIKERHPILSMLLPTSARWKELFILVPAASFAAFAPLQGALASLQTLHIWISGFAKRPPLPAALSTYEFAPNVTSLYGNPYFFATIPFPFSQITKYEVDVEFTCCALLMLLSRMPNLEILHCKCGPDPLLTLPTFPRDDEELHSSATCTLLARLTLPALRFLDIVVHQTLDPVRSLIQRSGCAIDNLSLELVNMDDGTGFNLLQYVSSLTSFKLTCPESLNDVFIKTFTSSSTVLPLLQSLELTEQWGFDPAEMVELKTSRPLLSSLRIAGVRH
ncbi:hypothetical protein C8J56DRAFT_892384 [Mycena floridula]|nr:hypothetical protein C8J56DRAFT_892384 [Mycena floridula]